MLASQYSKISGEVINSGGRWSATMATITDGFSFFGYGNSRVRALSSIGAYDSYTDQLSRYGIVFLIFLVILLFHVFKSFPEIALIISLTLLRGY